MRVVLTQIARMAVLVVAAGLVGAILVRYSPGALVDDQEMDQRLNEQSLAALRAQKAENRNVGTNFIRYLRFLAKGDLGYSVSHNAPITELIADRAPATLRELGAGLAGAWLLGLVVAIPAARFRQAWAFDAASTVAAGLMLSLPTALVAYLCLTVGGSVVGARAGLVVVIVIAPRIFRFTRNLLVQAYGAAHVEMARARGVTETRIFGAHVLPSVGPQMLALAAASASMAMGAAIPIEAICDVPGLGQLAWHAAMARDLPLLVNLTMLIAIATTTAMTISEVSTRKEAAR